MNESPFSSVIVFEIGKVPVTEAVVTTWCIMLALSVATWLLSTRLRRHPGKIQVLVEWFVDTLDKQIIDIVRSDPKPFRALIGSLFLYILIANWASLLPGVESPTAKLETDAALALIVMAATFFFGIRSRGIGGYLKSFAEPSWVMIPINVFGIITRTFSMTIRLFGNLMSGAFLIAIVLSLAGLLVPVPLMALDLLTGAVQAYIFSILSIVFIAAALDEPASKKREIPE